MAEANSQDPYCYPGSTILINKFGVQDQADLDALERRITARKMNTLPPFETSYDGLKAIHAHLFGDIYDWAGKSRAELTTIEGVTFQPPEVLRKDDTIFQPAIRFFEQEMQRSFRDTAAKLDQTTNTRDNWCRIAAEHTGMINDMHPFRDGNGRAMRAYLKCLAQDRGYNLAIRRFDKDEWMETSIKARNDDVQPLADMLCRYLTRREHQRSRDQDRDR